MFFRKAASTQMQRRTEKRIYENRGYAEDAILFGIVDFYYKKPKKISLRLPSKIYNDHDFSENSSALVAIQ